MADSIQGLPINSQVPVKPQSGPVKKEDAPASRGDVFVEGEPVEKRGLVLMQIDGLSHSALNAAVKDGHAPNLKNLMDAQGFALSPFQCGIATVTIPVLASLFYGVELPGNDWYDKQTGKMIDGIDYETNLREELASKGQEGIMSKGVVFSSPLSGGSLDTAMTVNPLKDGKKNDGFLKTLAKEARKDIQLLKKGGYSLTKTAWQFVTDIAKVHKAMRKAGVTTTMKDHLACALTSLNHNVIEKVACAGMKDAIDKGVPVMYTDFAAYDEKAHYFGPRSKEAMGALESIDAVIGDVAEKAASSKEKYEVLIFSDHGQTPSKLFHKLYGKGVGDVIKDFAQNVAESRGQQMKDDDIVFADVYSLGNVYFNMDKGRVDMNRVEQAHPQLIDFLTNHPGIGLVCGTQDGNVIIKGKEGTMQVAPDKTSQVTGENPLTPYGDEKVLVDQITSFMKVRGSGDLVIFGAYDKEKDEVVDFNQKYTLVSLHGGLGGDQTKPFIMAKPEVPIEGNAITEATQLHDLHEKYQKYLKGY